MLILLCKFLFFFSLFMIFYIYAGYPLLALLLSKIFCNQVTKSTIEPKVTILIAAYNEEESIAKTITNKLQLDYPEDKLEIIIISDESTDKTDEIVLSFQNDNVKFLRQCPRAGKTSALNLAVPHASGEILVFSDANSIYAPDALKQLVSNFTDPEVGYVTGKMIYTTSDGTAIGDGCSSYMKYENYLRKIETISGSIVGVDGGIDAMRKTLYSHLNADQLPDFVQPLKVTENGFRVIYEPKAILKEPTLTVSADEYRMRVRVSLRALWALKDMSQLLWGKAGFLFTVKLWSHKFLRYMCFVFLLTAYVSNIVIWPEDILYKVMLLLQTACYFGAYLSSLLERKNIQFKMLYFLYYFVLLNLAAAHATMQFLLGKKKVLWQPRKG